MGHSYAQYNYIRSGYYLINRSFLSDRVIIINNSQRLESVDINTQECKRVLQSA